MINYTFPIEELEYFLLIMTRVTCFIYIAPFFSMQNTPNRVKIGLGFFISILIYYMTEPHVYPVFYSVWDMAVYILKEASAGLIIGLGANVCTSIVLFAGRVIDMEMGFAMANQMDPTTKEQATLTGVYYQNMVMLLMLITGMYQYFISALAETFILIPVGQIHFNFDHILSSFIQFLGDYMILGMRICLPVFCTVMLLNAILGILAKVAPQMNMFAVGIQLKVLTGLTVLFVTVGLMPHAADLIFTQMKRMVVTFVEGMM